MTFAVQLAQEASPDRPPNSASFPVIQSPPAGRRRWILGRKILPSCPTAGDPQNAFQHTAAIGPGTTPSFVLAQLGKQWLNLAPLLVRQHRSASWHRRGLLPLYRPIRTRAPSTSVDPESGYETASRTYSHTSGLLHTRSSSPLDRRAPLTTNWFGSPTQCATSFSCKLPIYPLPNVCLMLRFRSSRLSMQNASRDLLAGMRLAS